MDVAYTESLQVKTGKSSITFAFLDAMNGNASLTTQGGDIAVDGLDGTASLLSNGGNIQVQPPRSPSSPLHWLPPRESLHPSFPTPPTLHIQVF